MILDYFENSWNDHEFLKNSFIIFMHILLAFWADMSFLKNASKKFKFTNFDFLQNREFLSKFNNFFSSESWGFILFKFYHARTRARTRARQNHIFWKFSDFGIFSKFPAFKVKLARACARAGAHIIKFEKYELSAFTGKKKINKFGQKAKIFEKNENAHEIRKKTTVLCPGVVFEIL